MKDKKEEALHRMTLLGIRQTAVQSFRDHDMVMIAEPHTGGLYELDDAETEMIRNFEEKFKGKVYMVVRSVLEGYLLDSLLYVSDSPEEWEDEQENIKHGLVMTYTVNHTVPAFTEFGSIAVTVQNGVPRRIY